MAVYFQIYRILIASFLMFFFACKLYVLFQTFFRIYEALMFFCTFLVFVPKDRGITALRSVYRLQLPEDSILQSHFLSTNLFLSPLKTNIMN
jgi:hypothetical protein